MVPIERQAPASEVRASASTTVSAAEPTTLPEAGLSSSVPPPGSVLPRGAQLGRYTVLKLLGGGGMGVVYLAFDPDLDRRVAIKLLRAERRAAAGESAASARLVREAQAMAKLSHPNVITVFDVGTLGEQVFVAMEYVHGGTLHDWRMDAARTAREVVAIYSQAGRGLAAAHAAGILHRDFKPDNVIVDSQGRARVLDFGLAYVDVVPGEAAGAEPALADTCIVRASSSGPPITHAGAIMGTPAYMAPEQLLGLAVDARTDEFSYCIALWEALYGERPFAGETLAELSASVQSATLREPDARARRGVPRALHRVLLRGLSTRPDDRFASIEAMLAEIDRAMAAPRRRAVALGAVAGTLVAFGLAAGLVAARPAELCPSAAPELAGVWDSARASAMREAFRATGAPYAEDAYRGAAQALDAYGAAWLEMRGEACAATRVRRAQSEELMDLRMRCLAQRREGLKASTELFVRADAKVVERARMAAEALPPVAACANVAALRAPVPVRAEEAARVEELRRRLAGVSALEGVGRFMDALAEAKRLTPDAESAGYRPLEAEARALEGHLLVLNRDADGALAVLDRAVVAAVAGRHESVEMEAWIDLVRASALGTHRAEGASFARHAGACIDRAGGDERALATLLLYEGLLLFNQGKYGDAIDRDTRALAIRERLLGPDHLDVAACLQQLGNASFYVGKYQEALAFQRRSLVIREKALGPAHPEVAYALNNVANALYALGEIDEALAAYRRALAVKLTALGPDSPSVATSLANIGVMLVHMGKYEEALEDQERALAIRRRALGNEHSDVAMTLDNISEALSDLRRYDEALARAEESRAIWTKSLGANHVFVAAPLTEMGVAYLGKGDAERALPLLEEAVGMREHARASGECEPSDLAATRFALARALWATGGDRERARLLAEQARKDYAAQAVTWARRIAEIDAALAARSK